MTTRKVPHLILNYMSTIIFIFSIFLVCASLSASGYIVYRPAVFDPSLKLGIVYRGNYTPGIHELNQLSPVTQFSFLGSNDILLLSKLDGKVLRVQNHTLLPESLLDVNVTNQWESGLLGIAISKNAGKVYVFLYYTESMNGDVTNSTVTEPSYNKLYRYELVNNKLINPKLLFALPSPNHYSHIGGGLQIGPDNNLYLTVGDMHGEKNETTRMMVENYKDGAIPDGRAGILRFTQDGEVVGTGILGENYPLNHYYAYGIRNSFGIDFDPVSGKLWDTEDGPKSGDEINLVEPGHNGGWNKIQGMRKTAIDPEEEPKRAGSATNDSLDLVDFGGKGKYSSPEFVFSKRASTYSAKVLGFKAVGGEIPK